ncbi:porin family protein [Hymenobacter arcticus]
MKKTLLSTALLAMAASAAHAQSPSFGIKAGVSLTNAVGSGYDFKNKIGFHGGFVANLPINGVFSIQPELLYSMKGYKFSGPDPIDGTPLSSQQTLHYIDVPILARIKAGGLFFEAGPQIGYLAAAKFSQDGNANIPASSYSTRNGYRKMDYGYAAGLGYQLPQGLGIGLRYNGSFRNLAEYSNGQGARNSAFQLSLSYMLGGK